MEFLIELSELSKKERIRLAKVKQNPSLLSVLAQDKEWKVKAAVAHNKNVPVEILEKLYEETVKYLSEVMMDEQSYNEVISVLIEIAKNSNTPLRLLQELAIHEDCRVRASAVKNPKLPDEMFKKLSEDCNWEVMAAVASSKKASTEMLYKSFKNENCNVNVKQAIAKHSKAPVELLIDLVIDEDPKVSAAAIKNLRKKKS